MSTKREMFWFLLAKLPVGKPTLFAITVEKPGGVVVLGLIAINLPLLAKVSAN